FSVASLADLQFNSSYTLTGSSVSGSGTVTVTSASTLDANSGLSLSPVFDNSGTVDANSGTLSLDGGGTSDSSFSIATGATLQFTDDYTLTSASSVSGDAVAIAGGTISVAGTYTVNTTTITAGEVDFNAAVSLADVTLGGGDLGGTGDVTITGTMAWNSGTDDASGELSIASGGVLNASAATMALALVFDNSGTVNVNAGTLSLDG